MNNVEAFLLHKNEFDSYKFMGCKLITKDGEKGAEFSVWAPSAKEVMVVGDFNNWDGFYHSMKNIQKSGFFNIFIKNIKDGDLYKYKIITSKGKSLFKADPYGYFSEVRPNTASIVTDLKGYLWDDKNWMLQRKKRKPYDMPLNIYELHLGSWARDDNNKFYSYREIADKLLSYVLYMGYTHIELLPVMEHPLDDSWGYQITGYFSLTSRFGSPKDFMWFVNKFHQNNIGIILDWVPGHFCTDEHGLYKFDGTDLFQYDNPELGENYDWGTANFDLGKGEVREFLISNAMFWFELYHIDGLRVDAVSNMLYLDYGTRHGMNLKNNKGTNINLEAVSFLKELNEIIFRNYPNVLMIAEESTSWRGVSSPTSVGGLGFNYKWNMGWMNDMLKYMQLNSNEKKAQHELITFSLMYAFSENYILPLSHDEVVHCKKSLLSKMPFDYDYKFSSLRLFYGYMMAHPGKKILFMGGEFGQFIEWDPNKGLDWLLLEYPMHKKLQQYTKALNEFYKGEKALWQNDHTSDGFDWIDSNNSNQSIISFTRIAYDKDDYLIVVCNFSQVS
ncbi:1,4-alpha-glucan branching protein GlgB, partial [Clostridium sp.]|uniref:1,4-alpha-glucan branching protein GlgB n=1 Tax=Clostridium sp. TaxID=1506 RepID=UPI0026231942